MEENVVVDFSFKDQRPPHAQGVERAVPLAVGHVRPVRNEMIGRQGAHQRGRKSGRRAGGGLIPARPRRDAAVAEICEVRLPVVCIGHGHGGSAVRGADAVAHQPAVGLQGARHRHGENAVTGEGVAILAVVLHRQAGPAGGVGGVHLPDVAPWIHHLILRRHGGHPLRIGYPGRDHHRHACGWQSRRVGHLPDRGRRGNGIGGVLLPWGAIGRHREPQLRIDEEVRTAQDHQRQHVRPALEHALGVGNGDLVFPGQRRFRDIGDGHAGSVISGRAGGAHIHRHRHAVQPGHHGIVRAQPQRHRGRHLPRRDGEGAPQENAPIAVLHARDGGGDIGVAGVSIDVAVAQRQGGVSAPGGVFHKAEGAPRLHR